MQPDRLAVVLRPRVGWEALDLGFQMAREWWRPIWSVWFAVYLPVAALCIIAFPNKFHAMLLLWWLKPVFDRAVLHTASRAVFGEPQGAGATLRAFREWLPPGLFMALTFSRFSLARSFALPISQLERQRGRAAHKRHSALGSRMRNFGVWLTAVCVNVELVAIFGIAALEDLLVPAAGLPESDAGPAGPGFWETLLSMNSWDAFAYAAAVSLVEPFYVTAGFALYLNRRAVLEGWDIELSLRRLEQRLRSSFAAAAMLVLAMAACVSIALPHPALAEDPAPKSAAKEIKAVLATPEFSQHREVERWHYLGKEKETEKPDFGKLRFIEWLSALLGSFSEVGIWIAAIAILCVALYYARRLIPEPRLPRGTRYRPPDALFGFDVTPESLPDDVAGTAAGLAREGKVREALSLLYRGALSTLVHLHRMEFAAGDTEADCARAVRAALPTSADYFANLVAAWQAVAYADRAPRPAYVEKLCEQWSSAFAAASPA